MAIYIKEPGELFVPGIIMANNARQYVSRMVIKSRLKNIMIVTDPGIIQAEWLKGIEKQLSDENIEYTVFSTVSSNPLAEEVMAGAEVYNANRCEGIVAIGGGSPMDCAKAIGIVSSNNKDIMDFEGFDKIGIPGPPVICLPSTSGSAAEVSQSIAIRDLTELVKVVIMSKYLIPTVAIIDPEISYTMDPMLTAVTASTALCQAIEAYVSNLSSPLCEIHALQAIKLINDNLFICIAYPKNKIARYNMMLASLMAGLAFTSSGLGIGSSLAHSIAGYANIPHGESLSIILPHVIDFNFDSATEKYRKISEIFHINNLTKSDTKKLLVNSLLNFSHNTGILHKLGNLGISSDIIPVLAETSINDISTVTNPRECSKRDLELILEASL